MLLENLTIGLCVGFLALIIASYVDIKIREVPDWLNFALSFVYSFRVCALTLIASFQICVRCDSGVVCICRRVS